MEVPIEVVREIIKDCWATALIADDEFFECFYCCELKPKHERGCPIACLSALIEAAEKEGETKEG